MQRGFHVVLRLKSGATSWLVLEVNCIQAIDFVGMDENDLVEHPWLSYNTTLPTSQEADPTARVR